MTLKVGDKVKISKLGQAKYSNDSSNPYDVEGVVRELGKGSDTWIYVNWPSFQER